MDRFFRFYPLIVLLEIFTIFGMNEGSKNSIQQCGIQSEQPTGPQISDGSHSLIWGFNDFFENEELSENTETDSSNHIYSLGYTSISEFPLCIIKYAFPLNGVQGLKSTVRNKLFILFHCLKLHL